MQTQNLCSANKSLGYIFLIEKNHCDHYLGAVKFTCQSYRSLLNAHSTGFKGRLQNDKANINEIRRTAPRFMYVFLHIIIIVRCNFPASNSFYATCQLAQGLTLLYFQALLCDGPNFARHECPAQLLTIIMALHLLPNAALIQLCQSKKMSLCLFPFLLNAHYLR